MKIVNEKFIESLKGARNISAILTYNSNKSYRILTNEASENITTELNELLATEKGSYEVKDNQLLRINPSFNASLFKTICKSLEIETTENIAANEKINIKIGVKVDEDYQFLNFGNYIVKDSTYQADTDTYLLVAYDKMMESMIKYDDNPLSITYPIEHKNLIIAICEKLNWSYEINDYLNSNAVIDKDLYSGQNLTYRDILDDLLTAVGENLLFDLNDKLVNKKVENSFLSDNIMNGNSLYLKEALESNALEYSIDGKCEQATRSGKNLAKIENNFNQTLNGINCKANADGSVTLTGTATANTTFIISNNLGYQLDTYTISAYNLPSDDDKIRVRFRNANGIYSKDGNQTTIFELTKDATIITGNRDANRIDIFVFNGKTVNNTIKFQLEQGSTATEWEQYGASPSPDYPSEIKTIKGIRNLFDYKNASILNAYIGTADNQTTITAHGYNRMTYLHIEPNTTYTVSKLISQQFSLGYCTEEPVVGVVCRGVIDGTKIAYDGVTRHSLTITTDDNANYLVIRYINTKNEPDIDLETILKSIQVEQGSVAHSYVLYGTYEKIKVTGKNLIKNTNIPTNNSDYWRAYSTFDESTGTLTRSTSATTESFITYDIDGMKSNTTYTLSCLAKSNGYVKSMDMFMYAIGAKGIKSKNNISLTTDFEKYTFTFTTDKNIDYSRRSVIRFDNNGSTTSGTVATLTIKDVMLCEGTNDDYEPYKEKEVLIDLAKENLFDKDNVNELNAWINATNGLLTANTNTNSVIVDVDKNTDYTISRLASDKFRIGFYNSIPTGGETLVNYKSNDTGNVITANSGDNTYLIIYYYDNNSGSYTKQEILNSLKVYKGTNADDSYELNSINETKDKLEIKNGVADIQKKIGKIVLNGNENWFKSGNTTSTKFVAALDITNIMKTKTYKALCDYFNFSTSSINIGSFTLYNTNTDGTIKNIAFAIDIKTVPDLTTWKSWLKANPVTVYYILNEPETITLPNTNIPLYEGINHVTLVEDLETTTSIIYKKPFIIDDELLKDVNVDFKEKYGPVNSLIISSNNTVINSLEDKKSIEKNGKITFNINDNYLLNYNSDAFINQLFNKIYNLEYYTYDFDSTGILVLEALDRFIVNHNNNNYNCLMLNDDIKLTTGLIETTYAEKPEENEDNYYSVSPQEKKINNALISIDKANAELVLKVDSNGKIAQVRLDGNADKGSKFTLKADNIELEGYSTINKGFVIDVDGNAQVHGSLFDVTNAAKRINPAVITVRNYNKGQAKGEYYADQIILSNNDGTDIFTVGDGNIGDYHGGVLTVGNDEIDSSITMYDGIINCVEVNQSSLESIKKNFEKLENGLSIVENAEIYKYNLKKENDDDKKHIGLVIGDSYNTPCEVISKNGNSIEIYSMVSVAWQCIKELNDKINKLEKEISKLKGEYK